MSTLGRAMRLLALAPRQPLECWDRISAIVQVRLDGFRPKPRYTPQPVSEVLTRLEALFRVSADEILSSPELNQLKSNLVRELEAIRPRAPYPIVAAGDALLGELCYLACRAIHPKVVIETGVLYGVTTAFILQALEQNGAGALHSIDLPPLRPDQEKFVGCVVPEGLRRRWTLHRGTSHRKLPELLSQFSPVDVFVHDSLHTYHNMRFELNIVAPHLSSPSAVIVDDVQGNSAFQEWSESSGLKYWATVEETQKSGLLGVAVR